MASKAPLLVSVAYFQAEESEEPKCNTGDHGVSSGIAAQGEPWLQPWLALLFQPHSNVQQMFFSCRFAAEQSHSLIHPLERQYLPFWPSASAYTLAPRQPDKEFLVTIIEPMPNNSSECTTSPPGPSAGLQPDEKESSGCWWVIGSVREESKDLIMCCSCLHGLSAKMITKPLDFLMEAKRSEQINKLRNKYLHRMGASTSFTMRSWEGAQSSVSRVLWDWNG